MPPGVRRTHSGTVIHEVDEALRRMVRDDALRGTDVEVAFDAPTKDWAARRNAPTVNVYLYDIREDLRRRQRGLLNDYENGQVVARRLPPGTSSCRTWSRPGRSARRTSTACCRSCWSGSCGTRPSRRTCSPAAWPRWSSRCP
nr:hypothetical protein GCM10017745_27460 [Saccharothrix mutabilis subsp. capreolus]